MLGEKLLPFTCFHPDSSFPGTSHTPCVTRDGTYLLHVHLSNYQAHHLPVIPPIMLLSGTATWSLHLNDPCAFQGHPHPPATLLFQCSSYPGVSQELKSSWIWSEWTNTQKQPFSQTSGLIAGFVVSLTKGDKKNPYKMQRSKEDEAPFSKAKLALL